MTRRLRIAASFALAVLALPALAAAPKKAARPAPAPPGPVELTMVHHLHADKASEVHKIVERFNADHPGVKVVLAEGSWKDPAADLMLLDHDEEAGFLQGKPRYKPLHQMMREAGRPLDAVRAPQQMSPTPLDAGGKLIALPIGLTTPILYFNKAAFAKAGLDPEQPPKTWWDLQQALGKLYDAGWACPYTSSWPVWIHVENVAAWHNEPFALAGAKGEGPLAINGLLEVKHLAMMVSWHKSRYLHVFGRGDQGDHKFAAGQCAVLTSDSSAFPQLAAVAKFDIGVATLPYHDDIRGAPQNTLADGPNLWVAAGRKPAEYAAAARFVAFLLTPEIQIEIQRRTGALPLNRAGVFAAAGSSLLANELPHIRVALQQLSYKPVTAASRRMRLADRPEVRDILAEELEALWADRKPAKEALDSAVSRSRAIRCC